jgi:uncharacterized protein YdaU (DUF1376 family)
MSKANAWMPLYIGDYMRDTLHLDATGHGAYLMLIMHYWASGPVKDDDRALANITRAGAAWPSIAATIKGFFTLDDGFLRHKRIDAEREKAANISDKRRASGIAGASVRYSKPIANAMANGMANAKQTEWQTHRQSQSQSQSQSHIHSPSHSPLELILSPSNRLAPEPRGKRAGASDPHFEDF